MNVYDLAVAGGGPAGCAVAITAARQGAKVLLLEAGTYPRQKVCGEFISAEALVALTSLIDSNALLQTALRIDAARMFSRTQMVGTRLPAQAASIPRNELDLALWNAALNSGCDARLQVKVKSINRLREGGFVVRTSAGDFGATTVVVASGRWSNLRKPAVAPPMQEPRWIGLKAHFRELSPSRSVVLYFFEGGYCGVQPVGTDTVNACAMVRSDIARDLNSVFELHPKLSSRTRDWIPVTAPVTTAPLVFSEPLPEREGVLYAGDAAAFVDPFVGDGISLALHSGTTAARVLAPVWQGRLSLNEGAQLYRSDYIRRFAPVLRNAGRMRRLLSLPSSMQALALTFLRIPAVSNRMVRMTRVRSA